MELAIKQNTTKSWWFIGIVFCLYFVVLFLVSLTSFRDVLLPVRDQSEAGYTSNTFDFNKFLLYNYLLKVFYHLFQISVVALVLKGGAHLLEVSLNGQKALWASIVAHFIFFMPDLLKITWFLGIQSSYTLEELHAFPEISLANLVDIGSSSETVLYSALSRLTIYEVGFVLALGWLLRDEGTIDYDKGLRLVLCSYGVAFSLWLLLLTTISAFF